MSQTFVVTLCHNSADIVEESLEQFYATKDPNHKVVHGLLDAHWPVDKEGTRAAMERIAAKYGCQIFDAGKNIGLHHGLNFVIEKLQVPKEGKIIFYDPDSWPVTPGWDQALVDALDIPSVGWSALWHPAADEEILNQKRGTKLYESNIYVASGPVMISVSAIRASFYYDVKGMNEPNPFYGGLEVAMMPKLTELGLKQVLLKDYREEPNFAGRVDPRYTAWKYRTCHNGEEQIPFSEWVRLNK